jgi:hypothetical protein
MLEVGTTTLVSAMRVAIWLLMQPIAALFVAL